MSPLRTLLVLGAGGHGKAVAEAALLSGEWQRVCFLDDRWPQLEVVCGIDVIGDLDSLLEPGLSVAGGIAAVGNNSLREVWAARIKAAGIELVSIVHPRAWVSPSAHIGQGSAVLAMAVIGTDARLGQGAIVNAGAVVDHDVCIGDFAHLGVGVNLAGGVHIGALAWLQAGCNAGYGVSVESGDVVAPGTALQAKH
jgi:sugar O-acyltransferase (sialic acid O-acetyltransferase NeuD family)